MRMSRCIKIRKNIFTYKSLPGHASKLETKHTHQFSKNKEASSCTCMRGSLTLEASVVFPFVTAFLITFLFLFRILQIEMAVEEALVYAGRMTAVEYSAVDNQALGLATAEVLFQKELKQYPVVKKFVKGGTAGVSLLKSKFDGDYVELRAEYKVKIPVPLFQLKDLAFIQRSHNRKWIGKTIEGEDFDAYVYVTKNGSVYHTSSGCHYIDLSIKAVEYSHVTELRNLNGGKYSPCGCMLTKYHSGGIVYITNYGTNYHGSLSCSGLKRTVQMIKKSEVNGLPLCSKCGHAQGKGEYAESENSE